MEVPKGKGKASSGLEDDQSAVVKVKSLVLVFFLFFLVYNANLRAPEYYDPMPSTYLPISILRQGDFTLDEFTQFKRADHSLLRENETLSRYPILTPLLASPVYAIPLLAGMTEDSPLVPYLGKIAASLFAALSCAALLATLRRISSSSTALILTLVYGFATSTWSVSSQALFQHGPSQLFLISAIYFLVRGRKTPSMVPCAGLFLGLAVLVRYQNLIFAAILSIYVFIRFRKRFLPFLLWASPTVLFFFVSNYCIYGSLIFLKGGDWDHLNIRFSTPFFEGLAGIFVSPGRGLLIYSPFFVFSIAGLIKVLLVSKTCLLLRMLAVSFLAYVLLIALWGKWHGGATWSYRLLLETVPILCILLTPLWKRIQKSLPLKLIFALLILFSVLIQVVGVSTFRAGPNKEYWSLKRGRMNVCFYSQPRLFHVFYDLGVIEQGKPPKGMKRALKGFVEGFNGCTGRAFQFLAPLAPPYVDSQR